MKWSYKLGEFAGIAVYVHATFLLLLGWLVLSPLLGGQSILAGVASGLFVLLLFACVVLHEYGHALMARHYGIRTEDIALLPIGGVARLERMPDNPRQELWVALAGPAVNVAIAAVLLGVLWLAQVAAVTEIFGFGELGLVERLLTVNISLVLFNLIPAFPMDGGRVLRALLATRIEYSQATRAAATIGQGAAFLMGLAGLFFNPILVLTALFIWMGAAQEAGAVQMKATLAGIPVRRAMQTRFRTLSPWHSLGRVADLLLAGAQADFPVVDNGRMVGMVTRSDLISALAKNGMQGYVGQVMRSSVETVDAAAPLTTAIARLNIGGSGAMPVLHEGQLVGLLTPDNVAELTQAKGDWTTIDPKRAERDRWQWND